MIEHNKKFYSLEELKRTRDNLEGYLDNEEVYYFVGAIRYACDEIERLNNNMNKVIADMEDVRDKNNYYDDHTVDNSVLTYWIDLLKGSDKE